MKITGIWKRGKTLLLGLVLLALASPAFSGVHRFVDERGVIHITTQAPSDAAGQETRLTSPSPAPKPLAPVAPSGPPPQPVTQKDPAEAKEPGLTPTVSRSLEAGGVIRITNLAPAPKATQSLALPASAPPGEKMRRGQPVAAAALHAGEEPSARPGVFTRVSSGLVGAFIKAATASTGPEKPAALSISPGSWLAAAQKLKAAKISKGTGHGSIRCFKNGQGVLCITNLPTGDPGGKTAPGMQLGAVSPGYRAPPLAVAPPPPEPVLAKVAGVPRPTRPGGIMVRRGRQGKIVISNLPPAAAPHSYVDRHATARAGLLPFITEAAQLYGLPVPLVEAVIKVESNFVPWAVSPKGAMGLMQLMPGTADFLGVADPFSPRENILGGCRYFRLLLNYFNQSLPLALAAYNAGQQRVVAAGYQVPHIKETQAFVDSVLGYYLASAEPGFDPRL